MTVRICVSILPKNNAEALRLIEKAESAQADLIEVRLDYLEESRNLRDLAKSTKLPLIATNKPKAERGFFSGTETDRQQTLLNAAKNGFEYVDVDFSSLKRSETIMQDKRSECKTNRFIPQIRWRTNRFCNGKNIGFTNSQRSQHLQNCTHSKTNRRQPANPELCFLCLNQSQTGLLLYG